MRGRLLTNLSHTQRNHNVTCHCSGLGHAGHAPEAVSQTSPPRYARRGVHVFLCIEILCLFKAHMKVCVCRDVDSSSTDLAEIQV